MSEIVKVFDKNRFFLLIAAVAFLVIISALFIINSKTHILSGNKADNASQESQDIVNKVGKLIVLPSQTPKIATVSDKSKLPNQAFFKDAQNGDKVLIYQDEAILYRPSLNKLIAVAPVGLEGVSPSSTPNLSPTPSASPKNVTVAIYNATKTSGLAKQEGDTLKNKYPNVEIVSTANTSNDYSSNIVVDLSGQNKDMASALAKEVSGTVQSFPDGETKPQADILIILGQ